MKKLMFASILVAGLTLGQVAPPTVTTPRISNDVVVAVISNEVVIVQRTNLIHQTVYTTNATLLRFIVDINSDQVPIRFTSYMSDGSFILTRALDVSAMTNRATLDAFNGLLGQIIGSGRRYTNFVNTAATNRPPRWVPGSNTNPPPRFPGGPTR